MALLVAGKNRALCLIIKSYLEQDGYKDIYTCHQQSDIIQTIHTITKAGTSIDLIILDTEEDNQEQDVAIIHKVKEMTQSPIIILVDKYDHILTLNYLAKGVSDFIAKPIKRDYLLLRVSVWLNMRYLNLKNDMISSISDNLEVLFEPYENVKKELTELKENIQKHRQYINSNLNALKRFTKPFEKMKSTHSATEKAEINDKR